MGLHPQLGEAPGVGQGHHQEGEEAGAVDHEGGPRRKSEPEGGAGGRGGQEEGATDPAGDQEEGQRQGEEEGAGGPAMAACPQEGNGAEGTHRPQEEEPGAGTGREEVRGASSDGRKEGRPVSEGQEDQGSCQEAEGVGAGHGAGAGACCRDAGCGGTVEAGVRPPGDPGRWMP